MKKKLSPYLIIILGYLSLIVLGTILFLLPISVQDDQSLSLIDSFFLSTSAVCITGFIPVANIATTLSLFGRIVLLALVEIGGLGFITLATFLISLLGSKIGYADRMLIKEAMNQNSLQGIVKLVRTTIFIALGVQGLGALINFIIFIQDFSFWDACGYSLSHSILSFNNAGFDLFPEGYSNALFTTNLLYQINTSLLIIVGGIGFIVLVDLYKTRRWSKLSIHTKIVLKSSAFLILFGMVMFKLAERNNLTWMQALFASVASRTAGTYCVDLNMWSNLSLLIMMILMFIGASPASTGGGIKTTTFYTVLKSIVSFSRGKEVVTYRRKISDLSIMKAYILITVSMFAIIIAIILIAAIEFYNPALAGDRQFFFKIAFEVVSGFGTVGYSLGITPYLTPASKMVLVVMMFFGRLGPITIISLWNKHWNLLKDNRVKYLEEKIIIG